MCASHWQLASFPSPFAFPKVHLQACKELALGGAELCSGQAWHST